LGAHTLYLIAFFVVEFATYDSLADCQAVERKLLDDHWYTEFRTLCVSETEGTKNLLIKEK
jgi:hypothetical protein